MVEPIKWKLGIVSPPLAIVLSVTALYYCSLGVEKIITIRGYNY
jgi:hypothetical protein